MLKTLLNAFLILGLFGPICCFGQQAVGIKEILNDLEQRFDVKFSYADADLPAAEITLDSDDTLEQALGKISSATKLEIKKLSDRYYALLKPKTIDVCGTVLDNFGAQGIAGATIKVLGKNQAVITGSDGVFNLEEISNAAVLQVRFLGYQSRVIKAYDLWQKDCPRILLAERHEVLNEVVVYQYLTSGITKDTDGNISLDLRGLGQLPGLAEPDLLLGVQSLPGIQSIDETVSDINIRGSSNDQNLILWNGIRMYQTGHFFGLISAFNPYLSESVSVYKNGTPSRYSEGVGGLIAIETNNEIGDGIWGGAGFNMVSGDLYGHIPFNDKWALQFSARRSFTDFVDTPVYGSFTDRVFQDTEVRNQQNQRLDTNIQQDESFFFYDVSGKVLFDLNDDHKFRLSFIGLDNDLDYDTTNTQTEVTSQRFLDQTNLSVGLQWSGRWSPQLTSFANVYFSRYRLEAETVEANQLQEVFQRNEVDERAVKLLTDWEFNEQWKWRNGFQYIETGINNFSAVSQPPFQRNLIEVVRSYSPFTEVTHTSYEERFIAKLGLRGNYIRNLDDIGASFDKFTIEPRLSLNFKVAPYVRAQVLGEFKSQSSHQIIDTEQDFLGIEERRWIQADEGDLPVATSMQGSVGLNYDKNRFYVGLEGFYKKVNDISTLTQGFQDDGLIDILVGDYSVYGAELLLNKKGGNYSAWFSYALNFNDYNFDGLVPPNFPNNLDVRHTLTAAYTHEIGNLQLGAVLNYRSGKPFTEPDATTPLDETVFPAQINYQTINSSRLPDYYRIDVSANYKVPLGRKLKGTIGASLINLTNRVNVLDRYYRVSDASELETVDNISLGITPNFSLRVGF